MRIERLARLRAAATDDSFRPASPHPELLIGEIAVRPLVHGPRSPGDRAAMVIWGRRMLVIYVVIVAAAMGYAILSPTPDKDDDRQVRVETCAQSNDAATDPLTGNISRRGAVTPEASPLSQPAHRAIGSSTFSGQPQQH